MFGGGSFGSLRKAKTIKLNDIAGSDKFEIKDSDGAVVFSVDSKGNVLCRGIVGKVGSGA